LIEKYFVNAEIEEKKTSDNWFVQQYYTFKTVFIDTEGYKMLADGLLVTMEISFFAVLLGVLLGMILALMKLTENRKKRKTILSVIASIYIDIIRGTPVVVQLMIMYMLIFRSRAAVLAAVVTFGMNSAAYVAEIIRAGILAVDKGQMEGGRSLGLSYGQTMAHIIVPQAVKNILPALCNEFIALIKETSIVGYVAIQDLTKVSDILISRTYEPFMPLIALAIIYYVIVKILTWLFSILERRLRKSDNR
jgi:His/Glu/Gln/Arg/opine family amino acid ABC transporter permease subunit